MRDIALSALIRTSFLAAGIALVSAPLQAATSASPPPVKPHLEATKAYPGSMVENIGSDGAMPEGRAVVAFRVDDQGQFQDIRVVRTSGVAALDEQTIKSVKQASCMECAGHDYVVAYQYVQK